MYNLSTTKNTSIFCLCYSLIMLFMLLQQLDLYHEIIYKITMLLFYTSHINYLMKNIKKYYMEIMSEKIRVLTQQDDDNLNTIFIYLISSMLHISILAMNITILPIKITSMLASLATSLLTLSAVICLTSLIVETCSSIVCLKVFSLLAAKLCQIIIPSFSLATYKIFCCDNLINQADMSLIVNAAITKSSTQIYAENIDRSINIVYQDNPVIAYAIQSVFVWV